MRSTRLLLSAPISFETADGETHAPMVNAFVDGVATRLILDTGASEHVFTVVLARAAGLELEVDDPGTDAAGDPVPSWRVGRLALEIAGFEEHLESAPVMEGPAPFEAWGIGGFISPQALHPTGSIVLDFADDVLTVVDADASALAEDLLARHPGLRPVWLDRVPGETTILVRTGIEAHEPVVTLLDSGARFTAFAADAVPGLILGPEATTGRGVGGREMKAPSVQSQRLVAGGHAIPIGTLFVTGERAADYAGLVGMDVLRGTVLVLAKDLARPVLWLVPA